MTTALGDLTQVPVTTRPTQALPKLGDVMVTLYNQDITNLVYVSYQQWFAPGLGNSIPIQPLTSITISAKRAIYVGSLVSGVASLLVLPEGSQANPSPAQIAAQINALGLMKDTTGVNINTNVTGVAKDASITPLAKDTSITPLAKETTQAAQTTGATIATDVSNAGVPLLTKSTVIFSNLSHVITHASPVWQAFINTSIPKPTYEIFVTLGTMAADAQPWARVQLSWKDSASGTQVAQQNFYLAVGTTTACQYHGIGPIHADQLSVFINNLGAASDLTAGLIVLNNSNPALYELWRQENAFPVNGAGLGFANNDLQSNYLAGITNAAIAAGANDLRLLPLYTGLPITIQANSSSNTTDLEFRMLVPASLVVAAGLTALTGGNNTLIANSDAKGIVQLTYSAPRLMLQSQIINHNAAAKDITRLIAGTV